MSLSHLASFSLLLNEKRASLAFASAATTVQNRGQGVREKESRLGGRKGRPNGKTKKRTTQIKRSSKQIPVGLIDCKKMTTRL